VTRQNVLAELQRYWWFVGLLGTLIGALGFQVLSPTRRLIELEAHKEAQILVDARQDSVFAAHVRDKQETLAGIQRQLNALIAGQCIKERNEFARVAYGCR
jgi:hypothetical protein